MPDRASGSIGAKEGAIGRAGKTTIAKRDREKAKQVQRRDKDARREQRKTEKPDRPSTKREEKILIWPVSSGGHKSRYIRK